MPVPSQGHYGVRMKHHQCYSWEESSKQGYAIRIITKLPISEQSSKGKVKTHKYINIQNQSSTGKLMKAGGLAL
jgi:hypothetical protein